MRDYYSEYLKKTNRYMSKDKVSKVPKRAFGTFDTDSVDKNQTNFLLENFLIKNDLRSQFDFEVEELTAGIMAKAKLSKIEACQLAEMKIIQTWKGLFLD